MTKHSRRLSQATQAVLILCAGLSCEDTHESQASAPLPSTELFSTAEEGEFLGSIFENGVRTDDPGFVVLLQPSDAPTALRLHHYSDSMWADTGASVWMYEWTDPKAGGQCGSLAAYVAGDTMARLAERHRTSANTPPAGKEKHCLRPGRYTFIVAHYGEILTEFRVDYLAVLPNQPNSLTPKRVWNETAQVLEAVESLDYNDTTSTYYDLVVNIDVTGGGHSETLVLDVENALSTPAKDTFTNQTVLAGSEVDHFRYSVARSSGSWALDNEGRWLTRIFFDYPRNYAFTSGFFDPTPSSHNSGPVLRVVVFGNSVPLNTADTVALELRTPDELVLDSIAVAKRVIQVSRAGTFACDTLEVPLVSQGTDQYFSAGCSSTGPETRYRWQMDANGPWTLYSPDTLLDFVGHPDTGVHVVTLEVRNTATSQSGFKSRTVTVTGGAVTLNGPTEIFDKEQYLYTSNTNGQWFERYNPAYPWYPATAYYQTSMTRIWPGGDYSVELRQQDTTAGVMRRGRLHITVCNVPGCGPAMLVAEDLPASRPSDDRWSLFGGGPWITWGAGSGRRADRYYDLLGAHDGSTPFADAAWVAVAGGSVPQHIQWNRRDLGVADARAFDFTVEGTLPTRVFGLALDPDLGTNPADDVSGYDAATGLVYVTDPSRAVGILLRQNRENALVSVQQFGVGRWAPTTPAAAWAAQRQAGVHLLSGPRDVQFVLSAGPTSGRVTYTLILLRASSVAELLRLVGAAIAADEGGP